MLSWIVTVWENISIWITNQPTFVEVAFGIGLFYMALQAVKLIYRLFAFLISPLLAGPRRIKKTKDMRPKSGKIDPAAPDDESPPFVFR